MRATFLLAVATVTVTAACGDEENLFDEPTPVPPGPHHTFVVNRVSMAASSAEAQSLGLDLDHRSNDGVDNHLGIVLGSVTALFPEVDHRPQLERGIAAGDPILLLSLRGPDLSSGPLELHTLAGTAIAPAPCLDELDEICGQHLDGSGSFALAGPRAPVPITGLREDGVYRGGAGDALLPFRMGGRTVWLPLSLARAELTGVSATGLAGKIGGAARLDDINRLLVAAYAEAFRALFAADCEVGGTAPDCGCRAASPGARVEELFDVGLTACRLTDETVVRIAAGLITPDIDLDGDGVNEAMSWGVGIEAVAAQFTP